MRATEDLDHPPHVRCAASSGAWRAAAMRLRAVLATLRLALVSALGVLGAVLALAPVAVRLGPAGRRVARLPAAQPAVAPLHGELADPYLRRRAGEAAQR